MIVFAADTAAVTATAALVRDGKLLAQFQFDGAKTHSETLLPLTARLLELSGLTVGDIDLFACTVGPGSFTGIRIGVSAVKGLAFGRGKPCVALSSTEVLAENYAAMPDVVACPVLDARRDQSYTALFRGGERLAEDQLLTGDRILQLLQGTRSRVALCGDHAPTRYAAWKDQIDLMPLLPDLVRPSAFAAARLAQRKYQAGVDVCTDATLIPVYLRPTQAERELQEKESPNDGAAQPEN